MKISLISLEDNLISIGVRRLAGIIRGQGHELRVLFMPTLNYSSIWSRMWPSFGERYGEDVTRQLLRFVENSDLVGFSSMTNYAPRTKSLIAGLRRHGVRTPIIWGGIHPTVFPEDAAEHADIVCLGEGETAMLELAEALEAGRDPTGIRSLWFRIGGKVIRNPPGRLMTNRELDRLPYMDYGVENNHILDGRRIVPMTLDHYYRFCGVSYNTIFALGCPFACTFCSNSVYARLDPAYRRIRMPSIDHVIGELSHVKAAIPRLGSVVFHDDAFFFIEKEVMQEFASRYRREIGLPFAALGATSTSITQEKVDLLVRAGMNRVRMGIQSGSPETLRLYNRRTPRKSIIEASRVLASHRRALIPTGYDLIVDNPYETREDVLQTIDLLDKLTPPFTLNMFSLQFLPGTRLARKAFEDGISDPDRESAKHYRLYRPTYINLIVAMFGIGKVPTRLLRLLTGSSRIHSDRTYPLLGKLIFILTLLRRGLHHLSYADFTVFPGRWAVPASRALNALPRRRPGFGPRDKLP